MNRCTIGATLALGLVTTVSGCGSDAVETTTPPPTPVRTFEAVQTTTTERIRGSGVVASRAELDLAFKIPGYVQDIMVDEGDRVLEGQTLARLQMTEADAQLRAALAQAELASRNLARMERLFADTVIAEARLDEARDVNERAQAGLELAQFNRTHAVILAPADGRILSRLAEVSEFTGPGAPIFRFGSTASGWVVRVQVPDHQVVRITRGAPATITMSALGAESIAGTVSKISDAADPRSGTFEVEIALQADAASVRSGMVATVEMELGAARALVYLPPVAIVDADGTAGAVFLVENGTARRHGVRIVVIGNDLIGVAPEGLDGARVVTAGAAYLRDGDRVTPVSHSSSQPQEIAR